MSTTDVKEAHRAAKRAYTQALDSLMKAETDLINYENREGRYHLKNGKFVGSSFLPITPKDLKIMNQAIYIVEQVFCAQPHQMFANTRKREIVMARHCLFYLLSRFCSCSYQSIGRMCSADRTKWFDHTIIIYARDKVHHSLYMVNEKGVNDEFGLLCIEAINRLTDTIKRIDED